MKPYDMVFPGTNPNGGQETGLTKREYFAVAAMQGLLANTAITDGTFPDPNKHQSYIARESLRCADALIEELSK